MSNFIVSIDDGSEKSVQAFNYVDSDGDLLLNRVDETYFENLFTAVMYIRNRYSYPRMTLLKIDDNSGIIILPINDEDNSILFMEVPLSAGRFLTIDAHFVIDKLIWPNTTSVIFTQFTELEYTFM